MSDKNKTFGFCFLALILIALVMLSGYASGASGRQYKLSDHYDGSRFHGAVPGHSFANRMRWVWEMDTVKWPKWIKDPQLPKPPACVSGRKIRTTYINHATLLVQLDGLNILTDPMWSHRAGPLSWLGSPRVRAPGVRLADLPPIDVVLVSHNHYDHLDLPTLKAIAERHNPVVFVGLGVKSLVKNAGFTDVRELDWWSESSVGNLSITFVPAQHNSGRSLFDTNKTLWGGYVINGNSGRIYFAGDTGYGEFVRDIARRYAPIDISLLPIGSYEKRWFMKKNHMNPDDAVLTHKILQSRQSIGMHFGTFAEHPEQAIDAHEVDLAIALKQHNVPPSKFVVPAFGEAAETVPRTGRPRTDRVHEATCNRALQSQ